MVDICRSGDIFTLVKGLNMYTIVAATASDTLNNAFWTDFDNKNVQFDTFAQAYAIAQPMFEWCKWFRKNKLINPVVQIQIRDDNDRIIYRMGSI